MLRSIVRPRTLRLLAAIGATLIGIAVGSDSWAGEPVLKHETWNWNGTLAAGRTLAIHGVNGEIVAEPSTGDKVEVAAEKSSKKDNTAEVKLEVVQDSDGITICAVYPGQGSACTGKSHSSSWHKNNDTQVDFHVKVPAGVTFEANTVNGGVTTRALSGPVNAHTVNGSCEIETAASGEASTVNGNVRATLGKVPAGEKLDFSSVNGSITLRLPSAFDADLTGSTVNGSISTDFPVTVQGKWGPRSMHGTIGKGGAKLNASTVNGSIKLTQRVD
jgi:hypothetical protein